MQELIKTIELYQYSSGDELEREYASFYKKCAIDLLEKEKEQITDACWYGHDIKHEYFNPIHYFDQTYNQNK